MRTCSSCGEPFNLGEPRVLADASGRGELALDLYHAACFIAVFDERLSENASLTTAILARVGVDYPDAAYIRPA